MSAVSARSPQETPKMSHSPKVLDLDARSYQNVPQSQVLQPTALPERPEHPYDLDSEMKSVKSLTMSSKDCTMGSESPEVISMNDQEMPTASPICQDLTPTYSTSSLKKVQTAQLIY